MKHLLFVAAFGVLIAPNLRSTTLTGRVTSPDGVPVAGVRVDAAQLGKAVWTDSLGVFRLQQVPGGDLHLQFVDDSYEPLERTVTAPPDGSMSLDVRFTKLRSVASSIEVVGRADEVVAEIPGSTFVVSKEELQASRPLDANEVMRRIPGVTLREDSGPVAMRLNVAISLSVW